MKLRVFLLSLTAASLWPGHSLSCEPTYEQMEALNQRDREIEEKYLSDLTERVDLIVVGRVIDVENANDRDFAQRATIAVERILKGESDSTATALMYRIEKPVIDPDPEAPADFTNFSGCGAPYDPEDKQPYIINGFRALFYVHNGILERVNAFPLEPELLRFNVNAEIRYLHSLGVGIERNENN
jgi:hypothetical protein